jgi:hypothetical protein
MSAPTSFGERLTFDERRGEWRDGDARYLMIRHDSLMGMFNLLPAATRQAALAAFAESVAIYGRRSAEKYRMHAAAPDLLLQTTADTAAQLGWGRWHFERAAENELRLEVLNSPFAAGHGPTQGMVCAPITGMLRALSALVFGKPADAEEFSCVAAGSDLCRFVAHPCAHEPKQIPASAHDPSGIAP